MQVTSLYAPFLALLFLVLSVRTLLLRRSLKIAIGDGDDPRMLRAARAHANFAEYAPLALILMVLAEHQGAPPWMLHALGAGLLLGRALHAYGVSQPKEDFRLRVSGMALTITVIGTAALYLLAAPLLAR